MRNQGLASSFPTWVLEPHSTHLCVERETETGERRKNGRGKVVRVRSRREGVRVIEGEDVVWGGR